ncbi:MAG: 3-hydroxyacyl-[acyl-carrier-protein] dehydratase FabZ [Bacteroidaceae bacterium]|nr:3-hydroxyacyl-[acyl-carrier-protein] dehydratase FabZ [Bacteroidaceae bacterium]
MPQWPCAVLKPETMVTDREQLMQIIPHREPMLLVDWSELTEDGVISGYTIPDDPYFTRGHFPGNPIVPGVILCEIMAQGSVLLFREQLKDKLALYAGMDKVRFKKSVRPGDTVRVHSRILNCRGPFLSVDAYAEVDGEQCCSGQLSFMLVDK